MPCCCRRCASEIRVLDVILHLHPHSCRPSVADVGLVLFLRQQQQGTFPQSSLMVNSLLIQPMRTRFVWAGKDERLHAFVLVLVHLPTALSKVDLDMIPGQISTDQEGKKCKEEEILAHWLDWIGNTCLLDGLINRNTNNEQWSSTTTSWFPVFFWFPAQSFCVLTGS